MVAESKWVVMTTINGPRDGLLQLLRFGYQIVVVGDEKTQDDDWDDVHSSIHYLSLEMQSVLYPEFSAWMGSGTYARKNIGYLYAASNGASAVFETDDDTFVLSEIGDPLVYADSCTHVRLELEPSRLSVWNPYAYFAQDDTVWPRGFPLSKIVNQSKWTCTPLKQKQQNAPSVVQMLVSHDPDVDAVFRLTREFKGFKTQQHNDKLVYIGEALAPGNTQATLWLGSDTFQWMYVPRHVAFRFTDILRSYVLQAGLPLHYAGFWAEQHRNAHDLMADFADEVDMYLNVETLIQTINACRGRDIEYTYRELVRRGVVESAELEGLELFRAALKKPD